MNTGQRVEVVTTGERLAELKKEWQALWLSSPERNAFLSWEWNWSIWRHHLVEALSRSLWVLVVRSGGQVVGIMPLARRTVSSAPGRVQILEFLSAPHADYNGVLSAPDARQTVAKAIAETLAQDWAWHILRLENIVEEDANLLQYAFNAAGLRSKLLEDVTCPFLLLTDEEPRWRSEPEATLAAAGLRVHSNRDGVVQVSHPDAPGILISFRAGEGVTRQEVERKLADKLVEKRKRVPQHLFTWASRSREGESAAMPVARRGRSWKAGSLANWRKLQAQMPGVRIRFVEDIHGSSGLVEGMIALDRRRHQLSTQDEKEMFQFYEAFVELSKVGGAFAGLMETERRIVAYDAGFRCGPRLWGYRTNYDPVLSRFSPGNAVLESVLDYAYADGTREYDFLRGEEAYKLRWARAAHQTWQIRAWHNTVSSRLLGPLYFRALPLASRLKRPLAWIAGKN